MTKDNETGLKEERVNRNQNYSAFRKRYVTKDNETGLKEERVNRNQNYSCFSIYAMHALLRCVDFTKNVVRCNWFFDVHLFFVSFERYNGGGRRFRFGFVHVVHGMGTDVARPFSTSRSTACPCTSFGCT